MKKLLLFDIDGTLLLTGGCGKIAFDIAFRELYGIEDAWGGMIPDGKTDPLIVEELVTQSLNRKLKRAEYDTLVTRYLELFRQELSRADKFRLMPGVTELLQVLVNQNELVLGLATGNLEEAAWLKLQRGGIEKFFSFGGFGSDSSDRSELTKLAIERGRQFSHARIQNNHVYVIGDTPHDIRAAHAAGAKSVVVPTGSYSTTNLAELNPTYLLQDLTDPKQFLSLLT